MALLATVSLWSASILDGFRRDLLVNLAFLFLGVLITVLYVDRAVSIHEASKWTPFQGTVDGRIRKASTQFAYRVEQAWHRTGPSPFMVAAWKEKSEPGLWHLELCGNDAWLESVRAIADGPARSVRFVDFQGDHQRLIGALESFLSESERALIMYGRILTPLQQSVLAQLVEEIPPETWLLRATQHPGANHPPANLGGILYHALALIEDANSRHDPREIILPWKADLG